MMFRSFSLSQTIVLVLVAVASCAWSKKTSIPKVTTVASLEEVSTSDKQVTSPEGRVSLGWPTKKPKPKSSSTTGGHPEPLESKPKFRYSGHADDHYILNEDDGHQDGKEFEHSEEHAEYQGQEEDRGYNHEDKKVDDKNTKDYYNKGSFQDFSQGGASFDKHHKDSIAENKENENVKEHDEGAKFGSEAVKEHKLGKHREKSVGHKKHGFKNVYHKEEYGDHKTFHDEFLDNDHFHDYDDAHEHKEMQGGRFSKGYQRDGENKEFNEGDENHSWGKEGHDGEAEGHYEKGGHAAGHHIGHKKHEGHHEASGHKSKHSAHKVKKGDAPHYSSHAGHHGAHQPQYYAARHNSHGKKPYSPKAYSKDTKLDTIGEGHQHRHHKGHYVDDIEPYAHSDRGYDPDEFHHHQEERTPPDVRHIESVDDHQQPQPVVVFENHQKHIQKQVPKKKAEKSYSFHHKLPVVDTYPHQYPDAGKPRKQLLPFEQQEPRRPHHQPVVSSYRQELPADHHLHSTHQPRQQHFNNEPHRPQLIDHHRSHFANQHQPLQNHHQQLSEGQLKSEAYPWWQKSRSGRRHHHHPNDSIKSPSHLHAGYAKAPQYSYEWSPRLNHHSNHHSNHHDHEHSASQLHSYPRNNNRRVFHHQHHQEHIHNHEEK